MKGPSVEDFTPGQLIQHGDRATRALDRLSAGQPVILVDDPDNAPTAHLVVAAESISPASMAFLVRHGSGIVCVAMEPQRLRALNLDLMVSTAPEDGLVSFTVSVDALVDTTTGVSASDRTTTVKTLIDPLTRPSDLAKPGHVFPIRTAEGGVLRRAGHPEGALDLVRSAGVYPAAVLCLLATDHGAMPALAEIDHFAAEHDLVVVTIADIIRHRRRSEVLVTRVGNARMPTAHGDFQAISFESFDKRMHVALVKGLGNLDEVL